MLEQFQNNTFIWFFLAVCTSLGIPAFIFAIITRKKDNKALEFACFTKSNTIVSRGQKRIKKLDVFFDNKSVDNVVVSQIVIWNNGNKTIKREDIASLGPFTIKATNGTEILNADIVYESDSLYCFKIDKANQNVITLDFEYIDSNRGIVIQLIHTGSSVDFDVSCSIKGGNPVKKINNKTRVEKIALSLGQRFSKPKPLLVLFYVFVLCASLANIVLGFIAACYIENGFSLQKEGSSLEPVGKKLQYSRKNLINL